MRVNNANDGPIVGYAHCAPINQDGQGRTVFAA